MSVVQPFWAGKIASVSAAHLQGLEANLAHYERAVVPGFCRRGGGRWIELGVEPKIGVVIPPKWMVKIMEHPIKMDDLGGPPLFLETPKYVNVRL